ncbi:MAG TPA: carboxypeptidase-like regulatory domain-containing protein [Polyangiaceae bacterium]|nr:carboxypeptidase-like regulatory domain-containing protein [Polyangiaceae bacterium]
MAFEDDRRSARRRAIAKSVAGLVLVVLLGFWFVREPSAEHEGNAKAVAAHPGASNEIRRPAPVPLQAPRVRAIRGSVRSADGRALAFARVCGLRRGAPCCSLAQCTEADGQGRFALEERSGIDELFASAAGHISRRQLCSPTEEHGSENTVVLEPAGAEIVGTVVDATGGVVPGALVVGVDSFSGGATPSLVLSDTSGRFVLPSAPGAVMLTAHAEGYSQASQTVQAPARGITLVLAPGASIRGTVVDAGSGAALADVTVAATSERGVGLATATSDAAGEFQLSGLEGGAYQVEVREAAFWAATERVSVAVGQASADVVLRAARAAKLRLTADYDGGAPCTDLAVFLSGDGVTRSEQATGNTVEFAGLPPGAYQAEVHCAGAVVRKEALELGRAGLERRVVVSRGIAISGRVVRPSGEPVEGVEVNLSPVGAPLGRSGLTCTTNGQGEFSCSGFDAGDYLVRVFSSGEPASDSLKVTLEPKHAASLLLKTFAFAAIRVSVNANRDDRPFNVFITADNGLPREPTLDAGDFVFSNLPLGRYRAYIDSPPQDPGQSPVATLSRDGQLERLTLSLPTTEVIAGRVLDENGAPVVDAWVQVVPVDFDRDPTVGNRRPAVSDQQGQFTISGLPHGRYDVHAESSVGDAHARDIVSGDRSVSVTVTRHARLSGTVRTASGVTPAMFTIGYQREGGPYQQLSGQHGRWDLGSIQPGKYRVSASSLKARATGNVVVRAGETRELTLELSESPEPSESIEPSEPSEPSHAGD